MATISTDSGIEEPASMDVEAGLAAMARGEGFQDKQSEEEDAETVRMIEQDELRALGGQPYDARAQELRMASLPPRFPEGEQS